MDDQVIKILLDLANSNAGHISVLNRELGEVVATQKILVSFMSLQMAGLVGLFWKQRQTHKAVKENGK